jgi:carbon starvation protein
LTVCTTLLIKTGKVKWAWVTGIPLAWDATVTLTASWQKVFSDSPTLGFFAQRARYQEALDAGKVLAPAKSLEAMQTVVTNSIVDGILAAFFALLVVISSPTRCGCGFKPCAPRRRCRPRRRPTPGR